MTVNNDELLTKEETEFISERVTTMFRESMEASKKESDRISPYTAKIWVEMFGDRKPSSLGEGLAMAISVRNEFYRREEAGDYDS